jgi:hypothetical protein
MRVLALLRLSGVSAPAARLRRAAQRACSCAGATPAAVPRYHDACK